MLNTSNYKKYANEILDDVETYKMVLNGTLRTFPRYFWTKPYSLESSAVITRYLFEERLKIKIEDIPNISIKKVLRDNKLGGMYMSIFNDSPNNLINNTYPYKFKPWEFNSVTYGYWEEKDNIKKAMRWLIEEKLKWNDYQIKEGYNSELLIKHGLGGLLKIYSLIELLDIAYPNRIKPWELKTTQRNYWSNKENVIKAIKWLIEEKLKLKTKEDILRNYTKHNLDRYGLGTIIRKYTLFESINLAYPGIFKEGDFSNTRNR